VELLTRTEAMDLLKLKASHFSKLVNGYISSVPPIPCIRIGRRQLFRREALERWILEVEQRCNAGRSKS
jgi:hypothetical protein